MLKLEDLYKFRIVTDKFLGYECQEWKLWWPFWTQISRNTNNFTNTFDNVDNAYTFIKCHIIRIQQKRNNRKLNKELANANKYKFKVIKHINIGEVLDSPINQ